MWLGPRNFPELLNPILEAYNTAVTRTFVSVDSRLEWRLDANIG